MDGTTPQISAKSAAFDQRLSTGYVNTSNKKRARNHGDYGWLQTNSSTIFKYYTLQIWLVPQYLKG